MVVASSDLVKPLHEQSILDGVLAHAKYVLGRIRCKYSGVPGPNDKEIVLDGNQLVYEAIKDIFLWKSTLSSHSKL